jgi:aminopeptidase N
MKNYVFLFLASLSFSSFAQDENHLYCSKRDRFSNHQLKSASLSVAQIAESERYNVHFYALDVKMNHQSTALEGTAEIHATANEALDSALFELFQSFTISQITVNGIPSAYSRVLSAIKVKVNASAGSSFVIKIDYNGTPPTAQTNPLGGAGMTNDFSPSWGNQVTWSLSEPFSAYEWWPCKQSLSDKADSCSVKITVPNVCKAGSNGILENVVPLGNGTTRYEWKHRHPIDYYLISVAVAKYVEYNVYANPAGSAGPVLIQNFIYDNPQTLPYFQADIDETVDFIELYADLFGPYPFQDEKYGHCMAPISGGMEHQTMTTQGFFEKKLTAHELSHQWWGNNVTCASWADIWINEGFASYGEYLMLENLYPGQQVQHMTDVHTSVMDQPNGSVYVLDSLNEGRIFSGRLSYDKGSGIIHTLRYLLNDDVLFFDGLTQFQNTFKDTSATGAQFRDFMADYSGIDLTAFFDEWYYGEGYPTYSARWNNVGSDLLLELTHTSSMPSVTPTFTNPIDVRFTRLGQADTTIRFEITSNLDQFLVPNVGTINNLTLIDPSNWVINKLGTKVKDVNFFLSTDELPNDVISMQPNPFDGAVSIVIPSTTKVDQLLVFDASGRKVMSKNVTGSCTVDTQGLPSNQSYIFVLTNQGKIIHSTTLVK